ncbi:MAG: M4 family metallopeptidase [Saprospiraceae bacterium]
MKHFFAPILVILLPVLMFSQKKDIQFGHTWDDKAPLNLQNINFSFNKVRELPQTLTFKSMNHAGSFDLISGIKNERGLPISIEGKVKGLAARGLTVEKAAYAYLTAAAPLMQVNESDFSYLKTEKDEIGMSHVKWQQNYKNVPIYGAEIMVHGVEGDFDFLNGNYYDINSWTVSVTPTISDDVVDRNLNDDMGVMIDYQHDWTAVFGDYSMKKTKVIFLKDEEIHLAFHILAYKNLAERWEYFIDAHSGEVLKKRIAMCTLHNHTITSSDCMDDMAPLDGKASTTAKDLFDISRTVNSYQVGSTYYMIDATRDMFSSTAAQLPNDPSGVIWTIDAQNTSPSRNSFTYDHVKSSSNTWSNKTSVSAHYNGGIAYNYFKATHNRTSINGTGGNIISIINVADDDGSSMGNAFWNGQAMFYGNGDSGFLPLARGLDVAGHEMSHGVIENTANLEYEGESGALNESFADVFGALIDRDDWLIGEDVVRTAAFPSGALRNLQNPHNGASTGNFNAGWQPKHYNERYTGSEDNGGVHLNSGIPNHAFYLFATAVGKDKAEKVYYRALSNYLTKSSKFVDARIAVIKAATDLYGNTEINAAKSAFDQVGILGDSGGNYETDVNTNPGQDFILVTGENGVGLFIYDNTGTEIVKISNKTIISKPSVTDDGTVIAYVASDKKMYYQEINWQTATVSAEQVLDNQPIWRNVILSKDGSKLAALYDVEDNTILVYDFVSQTQNEFELYNPTYSANVSTGDVLYADAMEFDLSGENIIYDAKNEINSTLSGGITYWDIGFINVWNNKSSSFALGTIDKLFNSLNNGVSVGNPTFSKNSPYIISFDYIHKNGDDDIVAANIERGELKLIYENNTLGFPNYSNKDDKLIFDNDGSAATNLGIINLKTNKIEPSSDAVLFCSNRNWAVWFSNGLRNLSATNDFSITNTEDDLAFSILQNPVKNELHIQCTSQKSQSVVFSIVDKDGRTIHNWTQALFAGNNTISRSVTDLPMGNYFVSINKGISSKTQAVQFIISK